MERLLLRTNAAVQDCERHLASASAFGTEIESYLTQYLLVILIADVQQEMYRLSEHRASSANDPALVAYVSASSRKILRSVGKKEIAAFIEMFGPDCKARLNSMVVDSEISIYSNAVGNRHEVAHNQGSQITFGELKKAVIVAEKLVYAAGRSIEAAEMAVLRTEEPTANAAVPD